MADLLFVALTFAFIALCVGYIWWCDRIIGPDDFGLDPEALIQTDTSEVTA
jgi:hypothetical protein